MQHLAELTHDLKNMSASFNGTYQLLNHGSERWGSLHRNIAFSPGFGCSLYDNSLFSHYFHTQLIALRSYVLWLFCIQY